jgi:NADPH:quinone reductase-like Zn-dependent oxidoreductase
MKAIVQDRYGSPDVLELRDVDPPTVKDDEVLVRIRAASVNPLDWYQVTGTPYLTRIGSGLRRPKPSIPGVDLAGQVEAVGNSVTAFEVGDEVFGMRSGAFAEYVAANEARLARKPANLTYEQAAAVPTAGVTALQGLRDKGQIRSGQRVLINGASGGVGTFAVQIAKSFGAEVTGVCSTRNAATAKALGADHVIDYTSEDFIHSGRQYDLILDIASNRSVSDRRRAMVPDGTLVVVGAAKKGRWIGPLGAMLTAVVAGRFASQRIVAFIAKNSAEDLDALRQLIEAGDVTPVIERTYPLAQVPEALAYLGAGHCQGKVVITS